VTPAVSVLVPTYQRREFVCRAVRSVFAQHYGDWELIVVDDGSTDGTEEALRRFGPTLRYLWQENRGVSSARNAGLRLARGDIVAFLDSDDRWLPDHLQTVVAMLEQHPEAVLASTGPFFHFRGRNRVQDARVVDALPLQLVDNWVGYPSGAAVRRESLLAVGGFDETMAVLEDGDMWLRLAPLGPFCLLQRRTVVRQHTRGSLGDRGTRSGALLVGCEELARHVKLLVEKLARPDASSLARRAEARVRYSEALRALADGDDDAVRAGLAAACLDLPELSVDPWFVDWRLRMVATDVERRLHHYETAARLWPDQNSDTALFLRLRAALLAFRLRRFRRAFGLARLIPTRALPGFLVRRRALIGLLVSRKLDVLAHRGTDPTLVSDPASR
jgi:hypothetical protein